MGRLPSIRLPVSVLAKIAMVYMALPLLIFAVLWLRPYFGALVFASLFVALLACLRQNRRSSATFPAPYDHSMRCIGSRDGGSVRIRPLALIAIILAAVAWCVLGGQGGFWYQSGDWNSRNALFRDLITHRWPLVYQSDGSYLCYYVAHWLPSALVGKAALGLGQSLEVAWTVANVALLCWTAFDVALLLLMVVATVGARTHIQLVLCVLVPILFSGPDAVGCALAGTGEHAMEIMHLEWWATNAQFSSITTCLFWVFNQAVIPWLCVLCWVNERSFARYVFLWACCLFAGPLPAMGLGILMIGQGVFVLITTNHMAATLRPVPSVANMLSLLTVVAIALYYLSSQSDGR